MGKFMRRLNVWLHKPGTMGAGFLIGGLIPVAAAILMLEIMR